MTVQIKQQLKSVFGYDSFRPQQEGIITTALQKKDTIVLMPTGGGKSVCFQIPALIFEGTTLVISPLISLMKDQVEALKSNGVSAAYFNSSQEEREKQVIISNALKGSYKLLYMAPETLFTAINSWLSNVRISFIAIDEAHCVSMWGHDFRPEYTQIHTLRNFWKDVPYMALTATADKATRKEIEQKLGLKAPTTFLSSFDRPNLSLTVRGNLPKQKKLGEYLELIEDRPGQSGIIYCLSRKETEEISDFLLSYGIPCAHYHAGLSNEERSKIQEDFINDRIPVITATIAFGMGIDKSNVRWVIHNNLPKNLEGYYQEIGRAGRDGLPSETRLYYNMRDVKLLADFAKDSPQRDVLIEKLNRMLNYAESKTCRRKTLLSYFSESREENCGNCDVCKNPPKFFDGTQLAQKALSGIKRTQEKIGMNLLIQLLRGAKTADIYSNNFQHLKTYGAGSDMSNDEWHHYLIQLLNLGVFEIAYDENFNLKITDFGNRILFGESSLHLARYEATSKEKKKERKPKKSAASETPEEELFQRLRTLRKIIATEENVPAYIVFSDATLLDMATKMPLTKSEFLDVSGVGHQKMENYSEEFIAVIKQFVEQKQPKKSTYEETYELLKNGLAPDEIAKIRSLNETTIYSHIAKIYSDGLSINILQYVDMEVIEKIRHASEDIEDRNQLKPFHEKFEGQIPYHEIRLALAYIDKEAVN